QSAINNQPSAIFYHVFPVESQDQPSAEGVRKSNPLTDHALETLPRILPGGLKAISWRLIAPLWCPLPIDARDLPVSVPRTKGYRQRALVDAPSFPGPAQIV